MKLPNSRSSKFSSIAIRPESLKQAKIACAHKGQTLVEFASEAIDRAATAALKKVGLKDQ